MTRIRRITMISLGFFPAIIFATPASATLILCGIIDNDPGDLNPTSGIIEATCTLGGGTGTFVGSADEFETANYDRIHIRGVFTGFGTLIASNQYSLGPWIGPAVETASLNGHFTPGQSGAGGTIMGMTTATTFDNNSATVSINGAIGPFSAQSILNGFTSGPGTLTATIEYDAVDGRFTLPQSGDFALGVPELSTWWMMIFGMAVAGGAVRNRASVMVS